MKTAFFIFGLAETASVPAEMKSQLYTLAYTVSRIFCYKYCLQSPSFFFFFNSFDHMEISQCIYIGCPVICIFSFIQIRSIADSKRFVQGFYPFLLALLVTEDAKS